MFNVGRAVFTATVDTNSSVDLDGVTGRCGSVTILETVRNPVSLARLLMDDPARHDRRCGGNGSRTTWASSRANEWFDTPHRREEFERVGGFDPVLQEGSTIGVVARDGAGGLAAATSTGGMNGKMPGRVGDTPIHGSGNWADDGCAVSCTGHGEEFVRHAAALRIATDSAPRGRCPNRSTTFSRGCRRSRRRHRRERRGRPSSPQGMYRGAQRLGRSTVAIWEDMMKNLIPNGSSTACAGTFVRITIGVIGIVLLPCPWWPIRTSTSASGFW